MEHVKELKWEQIKHNHGSYLWKAKVPGGYLVQVTYDIPIVFPDGRTEYNMAYGSSITFVPDVFNGQ